MIIGGIEAGGTKMVCAVGNEYGDIFERLVIPTENPEVTIPKMINFFKIHNIRALGIGCFGPLDLSTTSENYGCITSTPKLAWRGYNIVKEFERALQIPICLDTDVNAAAMGEAVWGAGKNCKVVIYITVGTGIGAGICIHGEPLHGILHPEAGHILLKRHRNDSYQGNCPYHKDCLEGLAAGPAIEKRWGAKGTDLSDREEVWELEAYYIAQAIMNYILILSPDKIILWGGVMHQEQLFPLVWKNVRELLNGYIDLPAILYNISEYIVPPMLGDDTGCKGALRLAYMKLTNTDH